MKIKSSNIIDVLVEAKITSSKSEAKRKVAEGAVYVDDVKILDIKSDIYKDKNSVIVKLGRKIVLVSR